MRDTLNFQSEPFELTFEDEFEFTFEDEFETANSDLQFIDPRIAVSAQRALITMSRSADAGERNEATTILGMVKSGRLLGLYEKDQREPAMLAVRNGIGYWQLLPPGEKSGLLCDKSRPAAAPMFVYAVGMQKPEIITAIRTKISPRLAQMASPTFCANILNPVATTVCQLAIAHPIDAVASNDLASSRQRFKPVVMRQAAVPDAAIIRKAFQDSRRTLGLARKALNNLLTGIRLEPTGRELNPFQRRVLISVNRWLKVDATKNPPARAQVIDAVTKAIGLIDRNLAVKTSRGLDPPLTKVNEGYHSEVNLNSPDLGIRLGNPFVTTDGPNCRRDVITHEFFHLIGVQHGGAPLSGPTIRGIITTPALALDSADNLAQLVSEIMNGRTDACTRTND